MDLKKMIAELQAERDQLDHAIEALEHLSRTPSTRRGRPPASPKKELAENPGKGHATRPVAES